MTVENVSRHIPRIVETALWSVAAGRCEICHKKLYVSSMTGQLVNISQKAHTRAFSPVFVKIDLLLYERFIFL